MTHNQAVFIDLLDVVKYRATNLDHWLEDNGPSTSVKNELRMLETLIEEAEQTLKTWNEE